MHDGGLLDAARELQGLRVLSFDGVVEEIGEIPKRAVEGFGARAGKFRVRRRLRDRLPRRRAVVVIIATQAAAR